MHGIAMTNTVEHSGITRRDVSIYVFQFISILTRLLGPVAYALQAVIPHHYRTEWPQQIYLALGYIFGLFAYLGTRLFGQKFVLDKMQRGWSVPNSIRRLVSSSLQTAVVLLLLADICNQQQVILLCVLMCGILQQKLSSVFRNETKMNFVHAIPLILMWLQASSKPGPDIANTLLYNEINTKSANTALFCAGFPIAILAVSLSHDIMTQNEEDSSKTTTLICVWRSCVEIFSHIVFLLIYFLADVNFPNVRGYEISKNLEGVIWTSSDLAIISTVCVMFATPIGRDTGCWLFENLFAQIFVAIVVLVCHLHVSKKDLFVTFLAMAGLQLIANVILSSKKIKV